LSVKVQSQVLPTDRASVLKEEGLKIFRDHRHINNSTSSHVYYLGPQLIYSYTNNIFLTKNVRRIKYVLSLSNIIILSILTNKIVKISLRKIVLMVNFPPLTSIADYRIHHQLDVINKSSVQYFVYYWTYKFYSVGSVVLAHKTMIFM